MPLTATFKATPSVPASPSAASAPAAVALASSPLAKSSGGAVVLAGEYLPSELVGSPGQPHETDASDKPALSTTIYGQHIGAAPLAAGALVLPPSLVPNRHGSRRFTSSTRATAAKAPGGCGCGPWRPLRWLSCGRGGGALEEEEDVSEEVIMIR